MTRHPLMLVPVLLFGGDLAAATLPPVPPLLAKAPPAKAAKATPEKAAQQAAEAWLKLVDSAKYKGSWKSAADLFKQAVSAEQWAEAVNKARGPLGKLQSRKLLKATYATELPGAPDGEYVVIQYQASFVNKKNAVETITPMKQADGSWKVSGYYIK